MISPKISPPLEPSPASARVWPRADRAPWHFRLAKSLIRHRVRGGYRLLATARKLGWLDMVVRYPLSDRISLDVPLYRDENLWNEHDLHAYEAESIDLLAAQVSRRPEPVTLLDCGADIGLFSALLAARCPEIARVVAFEPNPEAFRLLAGNVRRLPAGECHEMAVSDFTGRAELQSPRPGTGDHARFIVPSPQGDVEVIRIDDLKVDPRHGLLLKIDVEGAELGVLRGAVRTLSSAPWFVVIFEAHPEVVRRTGIDPTECMRLLSSVRGCRFQVAEAPEASPREDRPFFEQVPEGICNVVCVSETGG
jgi:FkbM family methyltransferase